MQIPTLLKALREWASEREDIHALAIVGSHARGAATPDSDLDVMLLVAEIAPYFADTGWAARFGEIGSAQVEDWGIVTSLRVFYGDGTEAEFGFATAAWAAVPLDAGTRRVVSDGMQILWDPHGLLDRLQQAVADEKAKAMRQAHQ